MIDVTYSAQGKASAIPVAMVALALMSLAAATSSQEWSQIAIHGCSDSKQRSDGGALWCDKIRYLKVNGCKDLDRALSGAPTAA
jgi:hypothetical protein